MTPDLRRTDLTYRVAVFVEGAAADEARDAGADIVGGLELVENIRTGQVLTSALLLHPDGTYEKVIKNFETINARHQKGTLTNYVSRTVKEAKEQSIFFEKDKTATVHVSFPEDCLRENIGVFF